MPNQINFEQIRAKLLTSQRVRQAVDVKVQAKFVEAKSGLIKEFLEHKVSQELMNPDGGNISNTLDGKDNKNLFGFIGFNKGSEPVQEVAAILEKDTYLGKPEIVSKTRIEYRIFHPSLKELYAATPMPWEGGRSWLAGISRGISGFGQFLAGTFKIASRPDWSASGQGIQLKQTIRGGAFKTRNDYIGAMIAGFRAKFGKGTN